MPSLLIDVKTNFQMNYDLHPNLCSKPTLFIHGNLASNRWWLPTAEELQKIKTSAHQFPMICAEFRGCGKSSDPKDESEVTVAQLTADYIQLVEKLRPQFGSTKWNLVGHSTGGILAAEILAQRPDLFNKAFLLDPVGAEGVKFDDSMIQAFEAMKVDRGMVTAVMNATIYKNDPKSDFFNQIVVEDAFRSVKSVGHWILKALDGLDLRKSVRNIQNPVMVVHGEFDNILPLEEARKLSELMPNSRFQKIADHGHCWNAENPQTFAKTLNLFLDV